LVEAPEGVAETGGHGLVGGGERVGVDPQRHGRVGVAEAAADGADVGPLAGVIATRTAAIYSTRRPEIALAITSRWISDVPSKIV
jgi:hypothetical protein